MDKKYSNPCSRCGKERIVVRVWKEKIGYSTITTTETACPDKECQKIVEQNNRNQKEKNEASRLRRKLGLGRTRKRKQV